MNGVRSEVNDAGLLHRAHALSLALDALAHWCDETHPHPIDPDRLESIRIELAEIQSKIRQLQADPALFTVVLLGGTGVGKSTLLNALAGSRIADAGIVRPTTQRPTVYHHRDVDLSRLDPLFSTCHAVAHDRRELRYKILIDTPDFDGRVREHHDRLRQTLPLADAVLYVGSQEKYHDREGWNLLHEHKVSQGFAFVLNKWDRCRVSASERSGVSPDKDFRKSLQEAGFANPLVFRTCANQWARLRAEGSEKPPAIEDDFPRLEQWIEDGLSERVIRDVKMRGIAGQLDEILEKVHAIVPPDFREKANKLKSRWSEAIREGVSDYARMLVQSADRHSSAFERHFARLGRGDVGGVFGAYLSMLDRAARLASPSILPSEAGADSRIDDLAARCIREIPAATREHRQETLHEHLLALADQDGWPASALSELLPKEKRRAWDDRTLAEALVLELGDLEREFAEPTGKKLAMRLAIRGLCEYGPIVLFALLIVKWLHDSIFNTLWGIDTFASAGLLVLMAFLGLHLLLVRMVPVSWRVLRGSLERMIEDRLLEQVAPTYIEAIDRFLTRSAADRASITSSIEVVAGIRDQLRRASRDGEPSALFARFSSD